MKKVLSVVLTLAMLLSVFSVFAVTNVSAATAINNSSPAITANVGTQINLSNYSVVFDGDTSATTNITWKNSSGSTISYFTPTAKGVTKLTATSGSKSKTIYVVAKNASDTEYVLYEADMSKFSGVSALKSEGWAFPSDASCYSYSGGDLLITGGGNAYAYLPTWLGEFGFYGFTVNAKVTKANDNARWFSLMFRANNRSGTYNYYQFAIRNNTTASNGLELVESKSSGWSYVTTTSGEYATLTDDFRNYTVKVNNGYAGYINNDQNIFADGPTFGKAVTNQLGKGYLGITMNGGTLAVSSVKVTVQATQVVKEAIKPKLVNNYRPALNTINPITNIERISSESALDSAGVAGSVYINANQVSNLTAFLEKCRTKQVIPNLYVNSTTDVNNVVNAITATGFNDVTVLATNASYLKSIRSAKNLVRTGLILTPTNYASEHAIRVAVRSAPATFCVIDVKYATKELVSELQEYAVAVWASINSAANTSAFATESITAATAGVNGVITNSASEFAHTVNKHLVANSMTRTPVMIGHRGNPSQAPENTLSGFKKAYENGADVFELDVEITSDGHVVVMHDTSITRTTTYTGSALVKDMTLAQVKSYYILGLDGKATTEKVPTLKEVCEYFKDKDCKIFVEYKGNTFSNVTTTAQVLKDNNMEYLVDCISFNYSLLTQMQQSSPGMSTGYLLSSITDATTPEKALIGLYSYLSSAQAVNSTINPSRYIVQSEGNLFTTYATDRGMTIWPWTYSYSNNDQGFFSGCDGVTTDDMQWATNITKYLEASAFSLAPGQAYSGGSVYAVTYGNKKNAVAASNTLCSVIEGEEYVTVQNNKLVALRPGTAKVIFGYNASTPTGGKYVIYSQPVTVTVSATGKTGLEGLIKAADMISISDYSTETIDEIRKCCEESKALLNGSASDAQIKAATDKLSALMADVCTEQIISSNKKYTTNDGGRSDVWVDDGVRLTDGSKVEVNGGKTINGKAVYSGWNTASPNSAVVTVDLGSSMESDTFRVYGAVAASWGISTPKEMTVYVSDDNKNFTPIGTTAKYVTNAKNDTWVTYSFELSLNTAIKARYVRFAVTPESKCVWLDEVEVVRSIGTPAAKDSFYVDAFNTKITSGSTVVYTSEFGTINATNANIKWAGYLIAKWDSGRQAYVVTSVKAGNGDANTSITLKSDEIMVAAHSWDIYDAPENPVIGSKKNFENIVNANVGDVLVMNGVDVSAKKLNTIAPHVTLGPACDHADSEWIVINEPMPDRKGYKELHCTECGSLIKSEHTPALDAEMNNLALGKDYTISPLYSSNGTVSYPDENGKTMTDGKIAPDDARFDDAAFAGFNKSTDDYKANGYSSITVDLGTEYYMNKFVAYLASSYNGKTGIHAPSKVAVYVSEDNKNWTEAGSVSPVDTEVLSTVLAVINLEQSVYGRYVQFRISSESNWMMVSEVQVYEGEKPSDPTVYGDVDNDGDVDSIDYLFIKRYCLGTYDLDEDALVRADVNKNGSVDSVDYLLVKRIVLGTYVIA